MLTRKQAESGISCMEHRHIRGNTWCLSDWQLIPYYRREDGGCILLDSGLYAQRQAVEEAMNAEGLKLVGILGSHTHTDHSVNHRYFQRKYHIPVAMSRGEAGLCCTQLNLQAYYYMLTPGLAEDDPTVTEMELIPDRIIEAEETEIEFCGVTFGILRTPGHSPDHIAVRTPDDVLYLGDALLAGAELTEAKLPYFFHHAAARETMERLRHAQAECFVLAHRGVCSKEELAEIIDGNEALLYRVGERLTALAAQPVTSEELYEAACRDFRLLTRRERRVALVERNFRAFLYDLRDSGRLTTVTSDGVVRYVAAQKQGERK